MSDKRKYVIILFTLLIAVTFVIRLFSLQVLEDKYKLAAENNTMRYKRQYPYRGLIYDRKGELLVTNKPVFDLMVVPNEISIPDTSELCHILGIERSYLIKKIEEAKDYNYYKPSIFLKQISQKKYGELEMYLVNVGGFYPTVRTVRSYKYDILANTLGYIGEVSRRQLDMDAYKNYVQGDYTGVSGIELSYEKELRGNPGARYVMVNARGLEIGAFDEGRYDTLPEPGKNLTTTIDTELQQYAEFLMQGKIGSVVAIEPETGEILTIASSPSYDPALLSGNNFGNNFVELSKDSLKPLYHRAINSGYPPGSTFKTVQALIALQEGVIGAREMILHDGSLVGDHAPIGYYDVRRGLKLSSNNYFYKVYKRILNQDVSSNTYIDTEIGFKKWRSYLLNFGLGRTISLDLAYEKSGFVPTDQFYDKWYGDKRWKASTIYSNAIGQGEILVVPLQMANIACVIANKGYYIQPHIVKAINGEEEIINKKLQRNYVGIDSTHFSHVIDGMRLVVEQGTGMRVKHPDYTAVGKTGTSQNPHGEDHSVFMAFAPMENPKIAVAVYVENAGQGARAAASVAGLVIEKHLTDTITRKYIEDYALRNKFIY